MDIIFMSYIDTSAVTNVSRMSKSVLPDYLVPFAKGMYETHCTSNCALAFMPCHPYGIYCWQNGTGQFSGT
jgi:hypothetical protein